MKYVGPLYTKLGGKYVKLREDSEYVDRLERENANMKRAAEIQPGVFENTIAENTQLQTELTEAKRRIDELERKEYQLKKDNIESLDLLAADTALQNRLADQIESKDKQIIEARARVNQLSRIVNEMTEEQATLCAEGQSITELVAAKDKLIEQMREALRLALPEARSTHCKNAVKAALEAERIRP